MNKLAFSVPDLPVLQIEGQSEQYPVARIFCVGRNYAAHAAEMGVAVDREAPFYFTKSPFAAVPSGQTFPYPTGTENFHFEMELAVMMGAPAFRVSADDALSAVFGYTCALDMTRRDLQLAARAKQRPWDLGKDVENSAVISAITLAEQMAPLGPQRIHLAVNGQTKQDALLSDLIHSVPEVIADLSQYYHLAPGDVILTGTPAGVGAVVPGDVITGEIDGLSPIELTVGNRE